MDKVVKNFLTKNKIDLRGQNVCIGISTGVDSSVLLYALQEIKDELGFNIILCHVNHKKRLQSEEEEKYIKEYAKKYNLILEVLHLNLDEIKDENFESAARMKRLEFFNDMMNKYNSKYLFLAHHLNDDMETSLMHMIRGSNLKGYSGINPITYNHDGKVILRPLLTVLKDDILVYSKEHHIKYYEDSSNSELDYTRNRIRHKVIPLLFKENESFDREFIQYKETLYNAYLIVCEKRDKYINEEVIKDSNKIQLNLLSFNKLNDYMQMEVLFELLKEKELSRKNILEILKLINSEKPNLEITYKDIYFKKVYNNVILSKTKQEDMKKVDIIIDKVGIYDINETYQLEVKKYTQEDYQKSKINLTNLNVIWYNINMLPVRLRNRKTGDRIAIKSGTKKVKDLLIDEKIPLSLRDNLLLLDKDGEVLNIFGVKKSYNLLSKKDNNLLIILKEKKSAITQ